jgi:hypothetical protein
MQVNIRTGLGAATLLCSLWLAPAPLPAGEPAEKSIYLVDEDNGVTAVNAATGQHFALALRAKERIERREAGNGAAVLVTNQRYAAVGAWPSGWASVRRSAGERVERIEAEDYAALVVTTDRILSFNGRTGSWSESRR